MASPPQHVEASRGTFGGRAGPCGPPGFEPACRSAPAVQPNEETATFTTAMRCLWKGPAGNDQDLRGLRLSCSFASGCPAKSPDAGYFSPRTMKQISSPPPVMLAPQGTGACRFGPKTELRGLVALRRDLNALPPPFGRRSTDETACFTTARSLRTGGTDGGGSALHRRAIVSQTRNPHPSPPGKRKLCCRGRGNARPP